MGVAWPKIAQGFKRYIRLLPYLCPGPLIGIMHAVTLTEQIGIERMGTDGFCILHQALLPGFTLLY